MQPITKLTENDAKAICNDYCRSRGTSPHFIRTEEKTDGSWCFIEHEEAGYNGRYEGIIVRADSKKAFSFLGALGKTFRNTPGLGNPKSEERSLGATQLGRYQVFDRGVANWEGGTQMAFPLLESLVPVRRQLCLVAFFDLRGFTSWSQTNSNGIQEAICAFEDSVHLGFPINSNLWERIFIKGTGDGVMIVSQADWYQDNTGNLEMTKLKPTHAKDFLAACDRTVKLGKARLSDLGYPLAIGCGIALGNLDRVFLFGRLDFVGNAANEAAKLQQHAWNEICVTPGFGDALRQDGVKIERGWELANKGWRLHADS